MGAMGCYPGGSQVEVVKMKPRIQVFRERPTKTYPTENRKFGKVPMRSGDM